MRSSLLLWVGASVVGGARAAATFSHSFNEGLAPFVASSNAKYVGQPVSVKAGALTLEAANHHYGVAAPVAFKSPTGDLVIQYEVELTEGLTCGGAYVKLLEAREGLDVGTFDNETPYVIMFGPDKCGATDKVHFILRAQNPVSLEWAEHHLASGVRVVADKKKHIYTAVVSADDGLELLVDGESKFKGNLKANLEPPLQPEKDIDDPADSKPADWVDEARIDDPTATKPADWDEEAPRMIADPEATKPVGWVDDAPSMVPDPAAERPGDWDDEEDGEWEAPEVANPACAVGCGEWVPPDVPNPTYKGKWAPEKIDNPAYKGEWAPRKIPNPHYYESANPAKNLPAIGALAVEIWTTNGGIAFDNFLLAADPAEAQTLVDAFLEAKAAADAADEQRKQEKKAQKLEKKATAGGLKGLSGKIQKQLLPLAAYLEPLAQQAHEKPAIAAGTGFVMLIGILYLLLGGKTKKQKKPLETAQPAAAPAPTPTPAPTPAPPAGVQNKTDDDDKAPAEAKEKKKKLRAD